MLPGKWESEESSFGAGRSLGKPMDFNCSVHPDRHPDAIRYVRYVSRHIYGRTRTQFDGTFIRLPAITLPLAMWYWLDYINSRRDAK